jgi:hypothetical protein
MADAGYIWLNALSGLGNNIAESMQQYHKEHLAYDQQAQMAQAMSRLGVTSDGRITAIDPENPDKTIQPLVDKKASEMFLSNNHAQQQKNLGAMEALNRIGMNMAQQTVGPLRQAQLKEAQLATQRVPATIGNQTFDLKPEQAANVALAEQPKTPSAYTQFRMQQAQKKETQAEQDKLPEAQFQKKYQLMPKDILSQPMGYEKDPNVAGNYINTTPVFRMRKYTSNVGGNKQDAYTPDPNGDIVNFHDQKIPYADYAALQNRARFVYDRARAALARGTPQEEVQKRLEAMGFDPAALQ